MNVQFASGTGISIRLSAWRWASVAYALAVVALLVGYWSTLESLVWVWAHNGTYQYAVLIFPLSAWLAYDLRRRLAARAPVPSVWGLVAVAGLVCIWYTGHALAINLLQHFAFVALFPALVLACWGWRALWVLKFPLGYLVVFAVPWGNGMVGPLQDITARMAVHALDWTGTPVLLNGRQILTPSATWMVAEACSGVRFFIACTALGCVFAYLMYRHWWKRVAFVVLAAVVPIVANGLRVYFTILIGETWGMKYATGTDHLIFGWQFFGTVLVVLLLVGWWFRDRVVVDKPVARSNGTLARPRTAVWMVALAVLVAGPVLAAVVVAPVTPSRLQPAVPQLVGWQAADAGGDAWQPTFRGAAGEVRATYRALAGGMPVDVYHAVYAGRPRRGHSLITYGNDLYDRAHASVLATATRHVVLADGARIAARELRVIGTAGPRLVWYWYCVGGQCTASPVWTKVLLAWQVVRNADPRSAVWALSIPIVDGHEHQARDTLRTLAKVLPADGALDRQARQHPAVAGGRP